jgi:hypothetical protein
VFFKASFLLALPITMPQSKPSFPVSSAAHFIRTRSAEVVSWWQQAHCTEWNQPPALSDAVDGGSSESITQAVKR